MVKQVDVVVIDDDEGIRWIFQQALGLCNLSCLTVGDGAQGVKDVIRCNPRLVIVDVKLGAMNGFEVVRQIRQTNTDVKILFVTGYRETITEGWAAEENILGVLEKPFNVTELLEIITEIFG